MAAILIMMIICSQHTTLMPIATHPSIHPPTEEEYERSIHSNKSTMNRKIDKSFHVLFFVCYCEIIIT